MSKFYQAQLSAQLKDPGAAAMLSIIPGLGHIYEGQKRKGFLFLAVSAINILLFLVIVLNDQMIANFLQIGASYHIQPNEQLIKVLKQVSFGSTVSIMFAGFVLSFLAYAIQDAYDQASFIKRHRIYAEHIMEMPEATSSSYIIHFALMASCFILAMFFLVPPKPKQQVTDIMFIQNMPMEKLIKPKTKIHAKSSSIPSGKHNPNKEIAKASQSPASSSKAVQRSLPKAMPRAIPHAPAAQSNPIPQVMPPIPQPNMLSLQNAPTPKTSSTAATSSLPLPAQPQSMQKLAGLPALTPSNRLNANLPMPKALNGQAPAISSPQVSQVDLSRGSGGHSISFAKSGSSANARQGNSITAQSTMPISTRNSSQQGSLPTPKATSTFGSNAGQGTATPTPIRSTPGNNGGTGLIPVTPSIPRPSATTRTSSESNSEANYSGERSSPTAIHDPNFGPYMDELQKRIKRCWFPPKDLANKRVMVIFKIHSDGSLSHLRIDKSSGSALADQAALKAVESAQPFRQLPKYAPSDVDIQFTFDYNVFSRQRR